MRKGEVKEAAAEEEDDDEDAASAVIVVFVIVEWLFVFCVLVRSMSMNSALNGISFVIHLFFALLVSKSTPM